jgi:hypothetical protein
MLIRCNNMTNAATSLHHSSRNVRLNVMRFGVGPPEPCKLSNAVKRSELRAAIERKAATKINARAWNR